MGTSKISPSPMSISFDENNEPTVHYDDGTSEKISSALIGDVPPSDEIEQEIKRLDALNK
jgi:hypothetical protein